MFREKFKPAKIEADSDKEKRIRAALARVEEDIKYKEYVHAGLKSLDIPRDTYLKRDAAMRKELETLRNKRTQLLSKIAQLDSAASELPADSDTQEQSQSEGIYPNRNIDYYALLGGDDVVHERPGASTWIRTRHNHSGPPRSFVTELLRPIDAQDFVSAQVKQALISCGVADEPIVVGVSGGGDSNALLGAIVNSGLISRDKILPVMMLGIPDWDKGADRASAICSKFGLSLRFVADEDTAKILGFTDPERDWVTAFEKMFPGDDLEVLGVYAVRKVLEFVALEASAKIIAVGSNLEDCLADVLYYLCAGKVPFPKPRGPVGRVEIVCPLWLTPKAVIDGCYPVYSRENYETRYPSRLYGRAYFYYLAQMLVDAYPGAAEDMVRGASKLSKDLFQDSPYDQELDTYTISPMPFDVRMKLRRLLGRKVSI